MPRPTLRALANRSPRSPRHPKAGARLLWAAVALSAGCTTPLLQNVTADSPASPDAAVPPAAPAGTALRAEPPLPGEDPAGWPDLGTPAKGGHVHHRSPGAGAR